MTSYLHRIDCLSYLLNPSRENIRILTIIDYPKLPNYYAITSKTAESISVNPQYQWQIYPSSA